MAEELPWGRGHQSDIRKGRHPAREILEPILGELEKDEHGAVLHVSRDRARHEAREVDERVSRGEDPGLLYQLAHALL